MRRGAAAFRRFVCGVFAVPVGDSFGSSERTVQGFLGTLYRIVDGQEPRAVLKEVRRFETAKIEK